MKNINAYVLSGAGAGDVSTWLKAYAGATLAADLASANLVVFTGGSDVTPSLYGEENVASHCDWRRDKEESALFQFCQQVDMPMFGICRGSQFIHVMMGGKLWQDVDGHCCQHDIIDVETTDRIPDTTSTHHQMVRESWWQFNDADAAGYTLIAEPVVERSQRYVSDGSEPTGLNFHEVEAYRYSRDGCNVMGIQGHPEWGGKEFAEWAGKRLSDWHRELAAPTVVEAFAKAPYLVGVDAKDIELRALAQAVADNEPFDRETYQASIAAS